MLAISYRAFQTVTYLMQKHIGDYRAFFKGGGTLIGDAREQFKSRYVKPFCSHNGLLR